MKRCLGEQECLGNGNVRVFQRRMLCHETEQRWSEGHLSLLYPRSHGFHVLGYANEQLQNTLDLCLDPGRMEPSEGLEQAGMSRKRALMSPLFKDFSSSAPLRCR